MKLRHFVPLFWIAALVLGQFFTTAELTRIEPSAMLDPTGNLVGDASRTFLDIKKVVCTTEGTEIHILVSVDGVFPLPETMLGMGFRFEIDFLRAPLPEKPDPMIHLAQLRLQYDANDWHYNLYSDANSDEAMNVDLRLETSDQSFTIVLPFHVIETASLIQITATTADFPKWTPVTEHPKVSLSLEPSPSPDIRSLSN